MSCIVRLLGRRLFVVFAALALAGCSSIPRTPYTAGAAASSRVLDLSDLRRYADEPASTFSRETRVILRAGSHSYLALSGGGADGAYGAGVLNGWTAAGTRPQFSVISGVSTGALIAPFAFLGSGYDPALREVYTSGIAESLIAAPSIVNVSFRSRAVRQYSSARSRRSLCRSGYARGDRRRTRQRQKASDRDDQSRHATHSDLGYGADRFDRITTGIGTVLRRRCGIRKRPSSFLAYAYRGRGKWTPFSGNACGRRSDGAGPHAAGCVPVAKR